MSAPNAARGAQRANNIVALLEHKPGPGIYSRLERAVGQLPENVRVQELPGLLKRYKDGIPGWELKAVDLDSVIAGRDVVPRDELLAAVRERSPVFTHKEVVLGGNPPVDFNEDPQQPQRFWSPPVYQQQASAIGSGISHGKPKYQDYGQGGDGYSEVLLIQPGQVAGDYGNHWKLGRMAGSPDVELAADRGAVAHLRHDTHGDALRINELQSDLGIHNRKQREMQLEGMPEVRAEGLPFPLEDAWADILTKRAVLEAARQGHRAIEVASPRSIADKVGGNIDNYEHFYGKVLPGSLERLGRKMGGLTEDAGLPSEVAVNTPSALRSAAADAATSANAFMWRTRRKAPGMSRADYMEDEYDEIVRKMILMRKAGHGEEVLDRFLAENYQAAYQAGVKSLTEGNMQLGPARKQAGLAMGELIARAKAQSALEASMPAFNPKGDASRRYIMSDEMRKNIITKGIPAAVAIGTATGMAGSSQQAQGGPLQAASDNAARAAMPWQTQRKIARLTKQVDAAYEAGDFKTAEKLDVQREQLVDDWDNKLEDLDEGDGDVDLEDDDPQGSVDDDMEPNDYEGAAKNYEEQIRDIYGSYVAGGPHFETEAELAAALRGVGPDTEKASYASDADLIQEARAAFDQRQAQIERLKSSSPEDGVRAMQARLRDMPAGLVAAPIMGQAAGVNERRELPTGSGGTTEDLVRGVVGENDFSMGISSAEWHDHAQRMQADGPSMEHQKFQRNVTDVLGQPIIRVGAARDAALFVDENLDTLDRITPAKFVGEYLDAYGGPMDDEARAQVMERVAGRLSGTDQTPDYMTDDIIDRMMGALKESSPQGKYAKVDPMPQEQLDALKQQHGDWAESMLTPGTAENFESLRGYELLRTTLDGQHAPVYADNLSNAMTFASGFVDGDSRRDFHDLTFSPGPEGRFSRANRDYFRSRARENEPAAFRDQDGTSRFASTGMNNVQGLVRAGGDMSTTVGAISHPLFDTFADFSRTNLGQALNGQNVDSSDWNFQQARHQAFDREQPILPTGMSREMFDTQRQNHQKDREEGLAWGATTYPNVQQAFDNVTGSKTQKTWGPPAYNDYGPNFFQNTVGNIPSAGIMAASAATGGLAGLAAGAFKPAGSTVRSLVNAGMGLGRGAAKGVGAAVASQGADLPIDTATDFGIGSTLAGPSNYFKYMGTAEQENALLPGVDPNSMSIDRLNSLRADALKTRDDRFFRDKFDWNKSQQSQ